MKVYLSTLGCKLNESELEAWARRFGADGYEIVDDARDADLCVVNTCAITHVAARKSRQLARQMARANPHARIVLTGCYADVSPDEAQALPNVALVVPNADKDNLVSRIANSELGIAHCAQSEDPNSQPWHRPPGQVFATRNSQLRTRAFVKIQDGCNMSCTYCIIPLARGKERSRARDEIVAEVQSLVRAGYQEIILTGVQISTYRSANFQFALRDLVAAILDETNVPRLRLTSIAPWDLDDALLDAWRDARVCRHLHLSLQSGSDAILRAMRRPYTTAQFARAVEIARAKIPEVGITTDVIVGFPGESDAEFDESLKFVEQMQFSRVHVFPYSMREGTPAATMSHQVADAAKQSRVRQMQTVGDASACAFAGRFVGRVMPVLWESVDGGQWSGYTDNYIRVLAPSDADLANRIVSVQLTSIMDDHVQGIFISDTKAPKDSPIGSPQITHNRIE
ncbi:MAG: tRNA (N(6)-L-threonylcarbamoyladenosine(37)-C(2))-methylthiotransferase MtaB [Chloroflexi bacterium]|nr:tRNA (N(6)-L-threonylcarbamoyladenosine(37)-C(2))-methylthiotransferase MtaB [Chloroflexota bacterium]